VRKNCINPYCSVRKKLYLLVIAILNQLNIKKIKLTDNFREKHNKNRKKTMWEKTL
jgi:cytochrome bd-type quinol oxidase subunit 2